jgi:hypothetical protein
MRHQKLHLIRQDPPISKNKVFPQTRNVRRVKQRHMGLFWRAVAFPVVARSASRHNVHPRINTLLRKRNNVLTGQIGFMEMVAAISTYIAISDKQLAVG